MLGSSPLNLYLIILWILDFKYILLLLLLVYAPRSSGVTQGTVLVLSYFVSLL